MIHLLTRSREPLDDVFYARVQAAVKEIKTDPDVRRTFMLLQERDYAIWQEGYEEGRQVGLKEALQKGIIELVKILRELNLSEEEIFAKLAEEFPDDEDMIRKIMDK